MSKVKIEGNASGTGTLTIAAPNTNTDRTLTLPDGAGEILTDATGLTSSSSLNAANLTGTLPAIDGSNLTGIGGTTPAFEAYRSGSTQTGISLTTTTQVQFNSETYDSDSCYDTSTYRFTPNVAGKYYLFAHAQFGNFCTNKQAHVSIRKNGAAVVNTSQLSGGYSDDMAPSTSVIVDANGTTDYFDVTVYHRCTSSMYLQTTNTRFGGFKIG
jgi:hypothetical protein